MELVRFCCCNFGVSLLNNPLAVDVFFKFLERERKRIIVLK